MNIVEISQSVVTRIRRQNNNQGTERRRGSERRIHTDRRKEARFGDVIDRRQQDDRRSD